MRLEKLFGTPYLFSGGGLFVEGYVGGNSMRYYVMYGRQFGCMLSKNVGDKFYI